MDVTVAPVRVPSSLCAACEARTGFLRAPPSPPLTIGLAELGNSLQSPEVFPTTSSSPLTRQLWPMMAAPLHCPGPF